MATSSRKEDIKRANYASILISASMTAATHPIQMTKVMIQVPTFVIFAFRMQKNIVFSMIEICTFTFVM